MKNRYGPSRRQILAGGLGAFLSPSARAVVQGKDDCEATEDNIEGPFYRADAPFRTKLRGDDERGSALFVSGEVRGRGGYKPISQAIVDVWQADERGHYDNEDERFDPKTFRLRGRMKTNAQGLYEFETVLPAAYDIGRGQFRPAHIHYKVSCDGFKPLTTQLYFKDDPHLAKDPWMRKSLVKELVKHEAAEEIKKRGLAAPFYTCVFNVVLKG